ncbi:hypothetical protein D082_30510 [Synechocystis sp. PCC 6714]|nr:hypothetical protein D082_30510 [Synechocystis sp. PCC 6714]
MVVIFTTGAKSFNNLGAKFRKGKAQKPYNRNKKYNLPYFTDGDRAMSRFFLNLLTVSSFAFLPCY